MTEKEFSAVQASASRAGLSLSRFLALTSQGQPLKSLEYQRERMELRRMKGEMGSIGACSSRPWPRAATRCISTRCCALWITASGAIQNLIARL
ncbi:plasmid mobilization protein [Desulfovibrio sp. 6_1_46AFAA]|uniref:plasmid mobilization protein n=1 Tax=Desulfovibrio sp. 6_1_46AFAA TaxID=665942 RepID=UPI003FA45074